MIVYVYIGELTELHALDLADVPGDINDAGGVLTFFIPAKNIDQDD